ncbi:hypothetical protein H257_01567 [Aphanomyces astaci]|uniref:Uncharacterized protein n=1 Tax=Aphanomyces astaci TaxID=112090 RepID=W4H8B4_APHAT|nr:hypothetical protein H257_01567 [Aphanomyces astaci]ETV88275.1 hypothetical protein H257_01567 [Aphanomyces astaci]|eukprot:XP_009823138.1 hypothetical protein H257_01567 [Aphanomyces astaci]
MEPPSPLRLMEMSTEKMMQRRQQAPSTRSVQTLQAELDSCLTRDEKEYVDDVVRQKAAAFSRQVAAKRRLRVATKSPSSPSVVIPQASSASTLAPLLSPNTAPSTHHRRNSLASHPDTFVLPSYDLSSSPPPTLESAAAGDNKPPPLLPVEYPPHDASLQLEHMLTREVYAQKHRQAMEHFAIKLEAEAAAWKQKYAESVVLSMRSSALEAQVTALKAANTQLVREVQIAHGKVDDVTAQLHNVQVALDTTQRQTQAMTMDVLDQTRLTNNEFEERLIQEQLTSAELREVVQHCMRQMEELSLKELIPMANMPAPVDVEPAKGRRNGGRRLGIRKRDALVIPRVRGTDDYMQTCPWMFYRRLFSPLSNETWPVEFQDRVWQSRSDAAVHQRWMDAVVATCSLPDELLALWTATSVLETTNALWVDKQLDDSRHGAAKLPTQSLPMFMWSWFLQKFKSRTVAAAQLYLFTVGLIEHKGAHARVEVMATLIGLSGVNVYLPRLADCLLTVVGALVPLPTLAGVLATSLVKPAVFDMATVEEALAEAFVTVDRVSSGPLSEFLRNHPFDRIVVSAESADRIADILGAEATKASHLARTTYWADDDGVSTSRSALNTTRTTISTVRSTTTYSTNLMSSRRHQSLRGKTVHLQLEVVLRLVVHVWLHQATQDLDALMATMQHEDSSEALDFKEFKTACLTHFPHEFSDREVIDMYETVMTSAN